MFAKGGKQNIRSSEFQDVTDAELEQMYKDPNTSKAQKQKIKMEENDMKVTEKEILIGVLKEAGIRDEYLTQPCSLDVYHSNNWDRFVMHWDEVTKNEMPSYIDFFFDGFKMIELLKQIIGEYAFDDCYLSCIFPQKYKLKKSDDAICQDIYSEFQMLMKSLGLKISTNKAIKMKKEEFIDWCDRYSFGGFSGISDYFILIPEKRLIIKAHHHMNYLFYTKDVDLIEDIKEKARKIKEICFC